MIKSAHKRKHQNDYFSQPTTKHWDMVMKHIWNIYENSFLILDVNKLQASDHLQKQMQTNNNSSKKYWQTLIKYCKKCSSKDNNSVTQLAN